VALAALEAWGREVFPQEAKPQLEALGEPFRTQMISYVKHGQWNEAAQQLANALGGNFNVYVNAYGVGGVFYNPADWDKVP
jgi:hypothetical protein